MLARGGIGSLLPYAAFAGLLVLVLGSSAVAAREVGAQPLRIEQPPRITETLARSVYEPHLSDRSIEWETWEYLFWFPNGYRLLAQFQITSAGPGRHSGVVVGMVVLPDRTTRLIKNSRRRDAWRYELAEGEVRLSLHTHRFLVGQRRHRVQVQHWRGRFEIEAEATTPSVELGPVRYSRDDRYELTLLAPRLRCQGFVQLPGETAVTLGNGWGIALHALSTLPNHRQALSVAALHSFDQPTQLSVLAFAAPRGRGQQSVGWLLVSREGRSVEVVPSFDRRWAGAARDPEEPNYLVPRALHVSSGRPLAVDARISLALVARFDILSWINTAIGRFLAGRVSHPVQYLFDTDYELRVGAESKAPPLTGKGFAMLSILNQPRAQEWP